MTARCWTTVAVAALVLVASAESRAQDNAAPSDIDERAAHGNTEQDAAYPRSSHFALRASGGAAYRNFYGIDVGLGTLALGAQADTPAGTFGGGVFGAIGETEGGLAVRHLGVTADATWFVGELVRLGVSPRLGWMEMDAFTTGEVSSTLTAGIAGRVSVDLFRSQGFALALGVEPALEALTRDGEGTAASVGSFLEVRYRFARALPEQGAVGLSATPQTSW